MTEQERTKAQRTEREFRETEDAFAKVREAFIQRLLGTPEEAITEREHLFIAIRVTEKVRDVMMNVIRSAADTIKIEEAAEAFRRGPER